MPFTKLNKTFNSGWNVIHQRVNHGNINSIFQPSILIIAFLYFSVYPEDDLRVYGREHLSFLFDLSKSVGFLNTNI